MDFPSYSPEVAANIEAQLSVNGEYTAAQVQAAVQAYTGMTGGELSMAGQSVQGMLSGQDPIQASAPLLGAAMLSTGVAAPVAAAVMAGLTLADGLARTLGPKNDCSDGYSIGGDATWKAGAFGAGSGGASSICVHTPRPAGPTSVYWNKLDDTIANWRLHSFDWVDPINAGVDTGPGGANVGMYRQVVDVELPAIADMEKRGPLPPDVAFAKAFCLAWKANAERAINGHPIARLPDLLMAVLKGWNATHSSSSSVTIPESGGYVTSEHDPDVRTRDSVVSVLLAGHLDGNELGPLTINAGPAVSPLGNVFLKFAAKGKQMASLGTLVEVQAPAAPAKPRTISLHGIGEFGKNLAGYKLTVDQKGVLEATRIAPPASDGFTVLGKHVSKKEAIGGGLIAGGLLALKFLL